MSLCSVKDDDWHSYRIVSKGSRHRIYIDGFATADFHELNSSIETMV